MADDRQTTSPEEYAPSEVAVTDISGSPPAPDMPAKRTATLEHEDNVAPQEMDTPLPKTEAVKPKRGRPTKEEKSEPPTPTGEKTKSPAKPSRGRPAAGDKAVPTEVFPPKWDKLSQRKSISAKAVPAEGEPTAPAPELPPIPRDAARSAAPEQIIYINLPELHPFKNHPFGIRDDAEMRSLAESVKATGVNQPALVRPRAEGGYEIIAGHRRQKASELAGYANMPCIVRSMTDDEAILAMTDDNLRQRTEILPMERAQSLKMQVEAVKRQGGPAMAVDDPKDAAKRSTEVVGARNGMNYKQVQRYIRLTELVPDLQKLVDEKKLSFTPAVEVSFIRPKNQRLIAVSIEGEQSTPSLSQAQKLRELDKEGKLNGDVIDGILSQEKKEVDRVILTATELNQYFGKDKTPREMKDQIIALLDDWKSKQPPERSKLEKKAGLEM